MNVKPNKVTTLANELINNEKYLGSNIHPPVYRKVATKPQYCNCCGLYIKDLRIPIVRVRKYGDPVNICFICLRKMFNKLAKYWNELPKDLVDQIKHDMFVNQL